MWTSRVLSCGKLLMHIATVSNNSIQDQTLLCKLEMEWLNVTSNLWMWKLDDRLINKAWLETFGIYSRIHISRAFNRMYKTNELLNIIENWKVHYLGHVMRDELLRLIIEGKVQVKTFIYRNRSNCSLQNYNSHLDCQFLKAEKSIIRRRI